MSSTNEAGKESVKIVVDSRHIRTEISEDGYEVYAVAEQEGLDLSDIQAILEADGIVYGVDLNAARWVLENAGQRGLVARGSRHSDGSDGFFKLTELRPQTDGEKRFRVKNVFAGDTVGEIHKPGEGSIGIDVFGRKVQPKEGKAANLFTGPKIKRIESGDKILLEATEDGFLQVGSASVEISPEFTVRQDVDYSDGEIEFAGSLVVIGDVKGSGSLKIRHDVHIEGSVEDAKIIAGGNVVIDGSFVGRGDGLLRAGGNVEVNVVLNQMIEAEGSITIGKESVNAHLIAGEAIIAPNARIMGGTLTAGDKIEINTLGGELYSTTRVKLGMAELLRENAIAIDKEIETQSKGVEQLKNEIYLLVRERIESNNFTAEKAEQLKLLQDKLRRQNDALKELADKKQAKVVELNRKRSPKLTILGIIHQSVVAEINGVRVPIKRSFSNVTFEELRNEIIRTKNL